MNKERLRNHICYASGPIDKAADHGKGWRQELRPFLKDMGINVIDPTDSVFCDEDDSVAVGKIEEAKNIGDWKEATRIAKEVVQRDLRAVDLSSFLIAYINTDIFMCGTTIEIAHAALQRKPVVVCCPQGKRGVPNFLWGMLNHEMFFEDWEPLKKYLWSIHVEENIDTLHRWKFLNYEKF